MPKITDAEIVIIGGGIIGCSIAYHLARAGKRDVLLIEKSGLTHGSTWHAVGMVGQLRAHKNYTYMNTLSAELYARIGAESGLDPGWKQTGSLRIASSAARLDEIRRQVTLAKGFGFEAYLIGPNEIKAKCPIVSLDGIVGAAYVPADGVADPSSLTLAIAKAARQQGVRMVEGVLVTGFRRDRRRLTHVETDDGTIRAETIVNAAGIWARNVGKLMGACVPAGAVHHQYLVTETIPDLLSTLGFRDPDNEHYCQPQPGDMLAVGGFEPASPPFDPPFDFGRELFAGDIDRLEPIVKGALKRIPALETAGVRTLVNGPIPMSADGSPVMGRAPELDNVFVATGFTSGISSGGGAGRLMADWIIAGEPPVDLWPLDIRRFGPQHASATFLDERMREVNSSYYPMRAHDAEMASGRPMRVSPLYPLLKAGGAVFGSKFGWERPNYFAANGADVTGRVRAEHQAARSSAILIDQSSFAKLEVSGPGALAALQRLAVNELDRPVGAIVYTQLCNGRGGIEADLTITRLADDRFYIVTGTGFAVRDFGHVRGHLPADGTVAATDVTSAYAVLNLAGPNARKVLAEIAEDDVSDRALPYMTARTIRLGMAPVLVSRLTFIGELGYELHAPSEYAARLYEQLSAAGAKHGLRNAGYRVLDTLRLEKANKVWAADLTPETDPYSAGLGFCVRLDKGEFIGREALLRIKTDGPARRFVTFALAPDIHLRGGEAILADGKVVGQLTSGGSGHAVGKTIGLGYVPARVPLPEKYEIEAAGVLHAASRHDRPLYDPEGLKLDRPQP